MPNNNRFNGLEVEETVKDKIDDLMKMFKEEAKKNSEERAKNEQLRELIMAQSSRISELEIKLKQLEDDKVKMECQLKENEEENIRKMNNLEWNLDYLEQHSRNECVRVQGVSLDAADVKSFGHQTAAAMAVHRKYFSKILQHESVRGKMCQPVDKWDDYIVNAHAVPVKSADKHGYKTDPLIVRFKFRGIRNLILANKNLMRTVDDEDRKLGIESYSVTTE